MSELFAREEDDTYVPAGAMTRARVRMANIFHEAAEKQKMMEEETWFQNRREERERRSRLTESEIFDQKMAKLRNPIPEVEADPELQGQGPYRPPEERPEPELTETQKQDLCFSHC